MELQNDFFPFTYLDMPLGGNPKTISFWNSILEKIKLKIDKWESGYIFKGGILMLMQFVLPSLWTYHFSIFAALVSISKRIFRGYFLKMISGGKGPSMMATPTKSDETWLLSVFPRMKRPQHRQD